MAVERSMRAATEAVRAGGGPRFLELLTYRFRAHSMYDVDRYRKKEEVARWKERDPIELFAAKMIAESQLEPIDRERIEHEVAEVVLAAIREAEAAPIEPVEDLTKGLYGHEVVP
jgi:pyruvate dehydrogenase E1 component alpha subunit